MSRGTEHITGADRVEFKDDDGANTTCTEAADADVVDAVVDADVRGTTASGRPTATSAAAGAVAVGTGTGTGVRGRRPETAAAAAIGRGAASVAVTGADADADA